MGIAILSSFAAFLAGHGRVLLGRRQAMLWRKAAVVLFAQLVVAMQYYLGSSWSAVLLVGSQWCYSCCLGAVYPTGRIGNFVYFIAGAAV